jgi:hypothetical protein
VARWRGLHFRQISRGVDAFCRSWLSLRIGPLVEFPLSLPKPSTYSLLTSHIPRFAHPSTTQYFPAPMCSNEREERQSFGRSGMMHMSLLYSTTSMVVFWDFWGGSVLIPGLSYFYAPLSISSNGNSTIIYQLKTGNITVSDPSQNLTKLNVKLGVGCFRKKPPHWGRELSHSISLPVAQQAAASPKSFPAGSYNLTSCR